MLTSLFFFGFPGLGTKEVLTMLRAVVLVNSVVWLKDLLFFFGFPGLSLQIS